jgi:CheY-like chemotaxis protein
LLETEHPDMAIIDIGLPGLNGYQVARRIRERPTGHAMLLVALTGYGSPDDFQLSTEAGFDHHLVKPIDPDQLTRLLSEAPGRVGAR